MKSIKKFFELVASFLIGVGIGNVIELIVSLTIGDLIMGVPEFIASMDSLVKVKLIQTILYGGFGVVGYISAWFYDSKKYPIGVSTIIQLSCLLIYYSFTGFYLRWFSLEHIYAYISSLLIYILIFIVIWITIYSIEKNKIRRINKEKFGLKD
ncbi:hypothetical protein HMPREF3189_00019 [Clostridiales bacterium KA00134]|nr:hypothetical protein HMPREF3189_00019 [Clostridiales bacterium KA00134]